MTRDEITALQRRLNLMGAGLVVDGIRGPKTAAAEAKYLYAEKDADTDPDPPASTSSLKPLSAQERKRIFGEFRWKPNPATVPGQEITILGGWEAENIVKVFIPQLKGVPLYELGGPPATGYVRFHKRAAPQLQALWAAWEAADLLRYVLTYDGAFNARYIRGSKVSLSNHAYGTAFDINAEWNGLGREPAYGKGSVRPLVRIAESYGFYWGGNFSGRADGMHFEANRII